MSVDRTKHEKEITAAILLVLIAMQDTLSWGSERAAWSTFETKVAKAIEPGLAATYRDSAVDLADRFKVAKPAAYGEGAAEWASARAAEIARRTRENTEKRVKAARARSTADTFDKELDGILGKGRAETIGVSEVTAAITAGERGAVDGIERETETVLTPYWQTEQDSKVCPVCKPLHGTTEDEWPAVFPDGPPAHPRCRCELKWKPTKQSEPAAA